ncbi:hypothetical protein DFH09DRAFT_1374105 [Mycena vulgaris]|nr:hypothetical protein DFH09DRAFT_1374105 [Mycena vulgaris]
MPLSVALAATRLDERRSIQRYISPPCIPPASLNDAVSAANADTLGLRLGLPGLDIYKFHPHRLLGAARVSDARSCRSGHSNPAPQRQLAGPPCILHTTSASSRRPPSPYPPHNIVPPALLTMFLHSSRSSELRSSGSHKQRNATCATLVVCVLQVVWGYAPRATLGKGSFPLRGSGPACMKAGWGSPRRRGRLYTPTWRRLIAAMFACALIGFIVRCRRPCARSLFVARRLTGDALTVLAAAPHPSESHPLSIWHAHVSLFCYFLLPLFFVPSHAAPSAPVPEDLFQSSKTESMHGFITYLLIEWGAARDAFIVERRIFVE